MININVYQYIYIYIHNFYDIYYMIFDLCMGHKSLKWEEHGNEKTRTGTQMRSKIINLESRERKGISK